MGLDDFEDAAAELAHPTAAWVWRQLIESTPWDRKPRYLIHDRDRVWGADFGQRASGLAIKSLRTPIRAPRANSIAERWVRTARRECLDHLIPISERHLRWVLAEFVDYYNHDRPHRSLGLQAPFPTPPAKHGVILGSRGHSAIAGLIGGSVTRTVMKEAPCSVLVVR